jgi:hypothetical protein
MIPLEDVRARAERALGEMEAEDRAAPPHGMEARPDVRRSLVAEERLRTALRDQVTLTLQLMAKSVARLESWRELRARSASAIDMQERRAATALSDAERDAWRLGARWLRGEVGGEEPGGVIAMRRELHADRLPQLPAIDEMIAKAEADLSAHVQRLIGALDAWDRRPVTGTMTAGLPPVQMSAVGRVIAR